jgi:arabinofuranosyltransferase
MCLVSIIISPTILFPNNDVANERAGYFPYTSLYRIIKSEIDKENYPLKVYHYHGPSIEKRIEMGYKGDVVHFSPGIIVYNYGDRILLTDQGSVADPLLPYMGVDWEKSKQFSAGLGNWRIGHLQRAIPDGYRESLQKDANLIKDPEIHDLYDKILLVVRSDLFTKERFKTIWELNTTYRHFKAK